jgi:hypothetical protein
MFGRATKRERGLDERVEVLERRMKAIEVEWEEWYDKFRRVLMRISKRNERAQEPAEPTNGDALGVQAGHSPRITNPMARRLMGIQEE